MLNWFVSILKDVFGGDFWRRVGVICLVAVGAWVFFLIFGSGAPDKVWGVVITVSVFVITIAVLVSNTAYRRRGFWIIFIACFLAAYVLVRLLWK